MAISSIRYHLTSPATMIRWTVGALTVRPTVPDYVTSANPNEIRDGDGCDDLDLPPVDSEGNEIQGHPIAGGFAVFERARAAVRRRRLQSAAEWQRYLESADRSARSA